MIVELKNSKELDQIIIGSEKVLIDFHATWCGPCKMQGPELEKFEAQKPEWIIVKVDVDKCPDAAARFAVQAVPTLVILTNAKTQTIVSGFRPLQELIKLTNKY